MPGGVLTNSTNYYWKITTKNNNSCGTTFGPSSDCWSFTTPPVIAVPDLIVTSLTAPSVGTIGGQIPVSATVGNQGTAAAGAFELAFYFSSDGVFDGGDTRSATTCSYSGLGVGATDSATCSSASISVPGSLTPGTYTLFATVDDLATVGESDETNNTRAADSGTLFLGLAAGPAKTGVFRNGLWVLDFNGNGAWDGPAVDRAFNLGQAGDFPVVGDWNKDGATSAGIFRNSVWVLDFNGNGVWDGLGTDRAVILGQAGDVPVVGDWDNTGSDKVGVFRNGLWVLDFNGNGVWDGLGVDRAFVLGQTGDFPVVGDWNKDGATSAGIFRNGVWVLDFNGNGGVGWVGDRPGGHPRASW